MIKKYIGYDVPVILYNGVPKLSQDLTKDDVLMGIGSEKVNIHKINNIKNKMYKIIPRYGGSFILGSQHRLVTEDKYDVYLYNISEYHEYNSNKFNLIKSNTDFIHKTIRIDPYFLGLWYGSNNINIHFVLSSKNTCIYEYLMSMIIQLNLSFVLVESKDEIIIDIDDKILNGYFKMNKLFERRHIPDKFKYNKSIYRLRLLAGILDSNSIYDVNRGCYEVIDEKEFIHDIDYIAKSLGFMTNIFIKKNNVWSIEIYGDNLIDIPMMTINNMLYFHPVNCDFKIAPITDTRCIEIEIQKQNILNNDFILI